MQRQKLLLGLAGIVALGAIIRWFYYINLYSVNLLFWDQWSFYEAAFQDYSFWDTFNYQHGPHKQGIAFVITRWLDDLSNWNTRVNCFAIGVFTLFAGCGYFFLKKRLFKKLGALDVMILVLALTPAQYALFTNVPNLSHGAMPAFLLTLFCLSLTLKNAFVRGVALVFINFLIIYSAFGIFLGFITPLVFCAFIVFNAKAKELNHLTFNVVMLLASIMSMILFFSDYDYDSFNREVVEGAVNPVSFSKFLGVAYLNFSIADINLGLLGLIPVILIICILIINLRKIILDATRKSTSLPVFNLIITVLISFSLLFISATALGRLPMGMHFAHASRYIPYLIPSIIAVYFFLLQQDFKFKRVVVTGFVAISILSTVPRNDMKRISAAKAEWKRSYLLNQNIKNANQDAGMTLYPNAEKIELKEKLDYLESYKLNLFINYGE